MYSGGRGTLKPAPYPRHQVQKLLGVKSWHPPPGLRQGSALLCRAEAGRPEEPCPTAHTSHRA